MPNKQSAILLCALVLATTAVPAAGQEICRPNIALKSSGHSEVIDFQRRWTGVFTIDASRCVTRDGAFDVEFVQFKDTGPDRTFTEGFAWIADETEVNLDLTWDEWVNSHLVRDVRPCPCR